MFRVFVNPVQTQTRGVKRIIKMMIKHDPDGPRGRGQMENTYIDRHVVRFHPDTARPQVDEEHGVKMRTAICGNGWVLQKRAGCRQKQYRTNISGSDFKQHMNRVFASTNHQHTIVHKLSDPQRLRQRWVVSDPYYGYNDESHYWYVPEDIQIRKAVPDTHIKRRDVLARKKMWPIATPSGRRLGMTERRSDMHMFGNPKKRYNEVHDRRFKSLPNYNLVYKY